MSEVLQQTKKVSKKTLDWFKGYYEATLQNTGNKDRKQQAGHNLAVQIFIWKRTDRICNTCLRTTYFTLHSLGIKKQKPNQNKTKIKYQNLYLLLVKKKSSIWSIIGITRKMTISTIFEKCTLLRITSSNFKHPFPGGVNI